MGQTPSLGGRAVEKKPGMEAGWMRRAREEKNGDKLVLTHLTSDLKEKNGNTQRVTGEFGFLLR